LFDLKGSEVNRAVLKDLKMNDLRRKGPTQGKVLKDLDYRRLRSIYEFFDMGCEETAKEIVGQLTNDI